MLTIKKHNADLWLNNKFRWVKDVYTVDNHAEFYLNLGIDDMYDDEQRERVVFALIEGRVNRWLYQIGSYDFPLWRLYHSPWKMETIIATLDPVTILRLKRENAFNYDLPSTTTPIRRGKWKGCLKMNGEYYDSETHAKVKD